MRSRWYFPPIRKSPAYDCGEPGCTRDARWHESITVEADPAQERLVRDEVYACLEPECAKPHHLRGHPHTAEGQAPLSDELPPPSLRDELQDLLNRHSRENVSNTPDFILADFLVHALAAFEAGIRVREDWYGVHHEPGR